MTSGNDEQESKYLGILYIQTAGEQQEMLTLSIASVNDMSATWLTAEGHHICLCVHNVAVFLHVHLDHCVYVCAYMCTKDMFACTIFTTHASPHDHLRAQVLLTGVDKYFSE